MQTSEYRKQVTERLIGMLESGTAPWQKPWDAGIAAMNRPHNFNGRPYHGVNALMLWCTAIDKGYEDPRWLTFNQVKKLGGHIDKGEKAQVVEYWQWEKEVENADTGEKEKVPLPHPKVYRAAVFNADQCSGLPPLERPVQQWTPHERADRIVAANGVQVMHTSDQGAFYNPSGDYIGLPPKESFATEDAYYSTLLHEVGHSTGHPTRLNREFGGPFGSEGYAKEELRAELASTFLCGELGIATTGSDEQHAAYVKSWVSALKDDYNEIFRAAADAEKICNYLYDREKEYLKEQTQERAEEAEKDVQQVFGASDETVFRRMSPEENLKMKGEIDMAVKDKTAEMPASDAQKGFMVSLGCKFEEDITKGEADRIIKERIIKREEYLKKINAPATKEQINTLLENKCTFDEKITVAQASKLIGQLPATPEQMDYMKKLKIEYAEDITRNGAANLIEKKMREFEERDKQPATENQLKTLKAHGIKAEKDITRGEARAAIYLSPATEKQLKFLTANKVEYDEKMCFGRAAAIISKIQEERNKPATKEQLMYLDDLQQPYQENITKGEAYKLIRIAHANSEKVTDEQLKFAKQLGLEVPEKTKRSELAQLIDTKVRENAIAEYADKGNGKENIYDKYLELAKQQYDKVGDFSKIDDKEIAGKLLAQCFDAKTVKKIIIQKSPVSQDYDRASRLVEAAAKATRTFQKSNEAEMGR